MNHSDDKTLEWLNRTQSLRKEPPIRGGLRADHATPRHTAASLGVIALLLFVLYMMPPPSPAAPPRQADAPSRAPSVPPGSLPAAPFAQPPAAAPPADLTAASRAPFTWEPMPSVARGGGATAPGTRFTAPLYGNVPPPAPIWLDGPQRNKPQRGPGR